MDLDLLAQTLRDWQDRGQLHAGEGSVVGRWEPTPVADGLRVGATDDDGRALVERWDGSAWSVERRYDRAEDAADHLFDRLGSLTASRYWGDETWTALRTKVHDGAVLRTAALLLWPEADLQPDRWDLVARLDQLGIDRSCYWVHGVDDFPEPDELVVQLRRDGDGWVVGSTERGSFRSVARCSAEADACRRLFRELISGFVVSMGTEHNPPAVLARHRSTLRAALAEALDLLGPD